MNIWALLGIITSAFVSAWGLVKYVLTQHYILDDNLSKNIINGIRKSSSWTFDLKNEFSIDKKYPQIYSCLFRLNEVFIYFARDERLLTAGWKSKEVISEVYFFRWHRAKVEKFIMDNSESTENINVMILNSYGTTKLGEIIDAEPEISLDKHLYEDIEADIKDMLVNKRQKTGCLLYGKPGTGKTRLVKYFAQKFKLPIYCIYLNPDYSNEEILMSFSNVPKRCIVLFEDFDNYFDKRQCILKSENVKFTLDAIINSLDGVYNDYKQVLFVMTANDINKIDDSIKHRSSRFKFVREITAPSYKKRLELLGKDSLAKLTEGMSLDKVFFVDSLKDKYSEEEIVKKINLDV